MTPEQQRELAQKLDDMEATLEGVRRPERRRIETRPREISGSRTKTTSAHPEANGPMPRRKAPRASPAIAKRLGPRTDPITVRRRSARQRAAGEAIETPVVLRYRYRRSSKKLEPCDPDADDDGFTGFEATLDDGRVLKFEFPSEAEESEKEDMFAAVDGFETFAGSAKMAAAIETHVSELGSRQDSPTLPPALPPQASPEPEPEPAVTRPPMLSLGACVRPYSPDPADGNDADATRRFSDAKILKNAPTQGRLGSRDVCHSVLERAIRWRVKGSAPPLADGEGGIFRDNWFGNWSRFHPR
jgi:hypothetical protein